MHHSSDTLSPGDSNLDSYVAIVHSQSSVGSSRTGIVE